MLSQWAKSPKKAFLATGFDFHYLKAITFNKIDKDVTKSK